MQQPSVGMFTRSELAAPGSSVLQPDRRDIDDRLSHGTARSSRGLPVALRAIVRMGPFVISLTTSGEPEPADRADRSRARGFPEPHALGCRVRCPLLRCGTRRRSVPGGDHAGRCGSTRVRPRRLCRRHPRRPARQHRGGGRRSILRRSLLNVGCIPRKGADPESVPAITAIGTPTRDLRTW